MENDGPSTRSDYDLSTVPPLQEPSGNRELSDSVRLILTTDPDFPPKTQQKEQAAQTSPSGLNNDKKDLPHITRALSQWMAVWLM